MNSENHTEPDEPAETKSRRRHGGRTSSRSRGRRGGSRKRETIGERVNRHFLLAGVICIALVLIAAAYLFGREQAVRAAARNAATQTAGQTAIALPSTSQPPHALDADTLARLVEVHQAREAGSPGAFLAALDAMADEADESPAWLDIKRAAARLRQDDGLGAISLLDKVEGKRAPPDPSIAEFTAAMRANGGDISRAMLVLDEAIAMNPASWRLRLAKSDILRRAGQRNEGFNICREAALFADLPWEQSIVHTKLLLAGVEAGDAPTLQAIRQGLADEPEAVRWQIAGAAAALGANDRTAAKPLLESARRHLDPGLYMWFAADTVFDFHRIDPEFSSLLNAQD